MASGSARNNGSQTVHFFRHRFQFNEPGLAAGIQIGRLPARAFIQSMALYTAEAFTSGAIQVGSTQGGDDFLAATPAATVGYVVLDEAAGLGMVVGPYEEDLWVQVALDGEPPTEGDATLVITYIPDNDG